MPRIAGALMLLALSACAGQRVPKTCPVETRLVEVPVLRYVEIDPLITAPVPEPAPPPNITCGDFRNAAELRGQALGQCNDKLHAAGSIQGTDKVE